jgi:hypothetical protein
MIEYYKRSWLSRMLNRAVRNPLTWTTFAVGMVRFHKAVELIEDVLKVHSWFS